MPRPSINLEPYKAEIINLYQNNTSPSSIQELLYNRYGVQVTSRTIESRLQSWEIRKQNRTASSDTVLHARIKVLFFQVGLEEKDLLRVLQKEGFDIKAGTLKYIRHSLGLYRRTTNTVVAQQQVELVITSLEKQIQQGQIEGYGKELLHRHFRRHGFMISRDRLFSLYRTLSPASVQRRLHDLQRHRGAYIVPGPNYIWSIDGYLKLAPYGIEIYAAIDAYSRYIIWIYVGISARTAVSVLRQYLDALQVTEQQPTFVRSDRGTETILLAEAHHKLQQSKSPEKLLSDCYLYGTSTANQRIKSWWLQLTKGLIFRWRNYFHSLQEEGYFSKDSIPDQIALLAIYLPILRTEITSFVRTWNNHSIQKQRLRPHLVHGKPYINYNYPADDVQNYGLEFNKELLQDLQKDVQDYNPDEYLPLNTYNWAVQQLQELNFDPNNPFEHLTEDIFTPFHTIYLEFQARIIQHMQQGSPPHLTLLEKPIGAFNWQPQGISNSIQEVEVLYNHNEHNS